MNCVFCGATNNLNTTFQILLDDGQKIQVNICDEHSEDATVKTAKAAYLLKQKQIEQFLEQAKALGLNISINNNISVATAPVATPAVQRAQTYPQSQYDYITDDPNARIVDTDGLDMNTPRIQVTGANQYGVADSVNVNSLSDKLDPRVLKGKAKIVMAEGRQGIPISIAEQRTDGTGTTRITINNKMNDIKLQDSFKRMAENSLMDNGPDFAQKGYSESTHRCTFCQGNGTIRDNRSLATCPKCKGSGLISFY